MLGSVQALGVRRLPTSSAGGTRVPRLRARADTLSIAPAEADPRIDGQVGLDPRGDRGRRVDSGSCARRVRRDSRSGHAEREEGLAGQDRRQAVRRRQKGGAGGGDPGRAPLVRGTARRGRRLVQAVRQRSFCFWCDRYSHHATRQLDPLVLLHLVFTRGAPRVGHRPAGLQGRARGRGVSSCGRRARKELPATRGGASRSRRTVGLASELVRSRLLLRCERC